MGNIIIYIALVLMVPIALLLAYVEKKSRFILIGVLCGCLGCFIAYYLNNFLFETLQTTEHYYSATIGPIVEEILKFVPVLLFGLLYSKDSKILIPIAFSVGVGFSVAENFFYLINYSFEADVFWVIGRCIGAGLMHAVSTSIVALGLTLSFKDKRLIVVGIICSMFIAIIYHGTFNLLILNETLKVVGAVIPIITYLLFVFLLRKEEIKKFVLEEK